MRFQKLAIIFTLVGLSFSSALAQTGAPDQKFSDDKLTEILRVKQAEMDAQQGKISPPAAKPAKPVRVEPRKAAKETPPIQPPRMSQPKMVVTQPVVDAATEEKLVEVLRKKQAELDAQDMSSSRSGPITTAAEAKKAAKEREESEKRIQRIESDIKAKEEAMKKRAAAQPKVAPVTQTNPVPPSKKTEAVNAALETSTASKKQTAQTKSSKKQTAPTPTVDLSTKEGRLAELLRKYKADEITPHDYHLERAKIIAEP